MKLLYCLAAAFLAMSSVSRGQPKNDAQLLVGLWRQDGDTAHKIILRRADGTYQEKVYGLYDLNRPPMYYTSSGTWKVRGNQYVILCEKISAEVWSKRQAGRTFRETIRRIMPGNFKYVTTDGAEAEERQVGQASDAGFSQVQPEAILPREVRRAIPVTFQEDHVIY